MHSQEEDVEEAEVVNDDEIVDTTVDTAFDTDTDNNNNEQ
jgi:hypothetical protein